MSNPTDRHRPARSTGHGSRRRVRGEKGYALVLTALMLLPLLAFTGFATDVGAWYARASRIQRAADAASLAGVVWMPDVGRATSEALTTAKRDGFDPAVDSDIAITVTPIGQQRLRVKIVDNSVDQFFSSLFINRVDIARQATAEYVKSIPMGSPINSLGNDPDTGSAPGFWLNISGPQGVKANGDRHTAKRCDNVNGSGSSFSGCNGQSSTSTNLEYSEDGYMYRVQVGAVGSGPLNIQVFDPAFFFTGDICDTANLLDPAEANYTTEINALNAQTVGGALPNPATRYVRGNTAFCPGDQSINGANVQTTYIVRGPDNTPFDNFDNPVISGCSRTFDAYNEDVYRLLNQTDGYRDGNIGSENLRFSDHFRRWFTMCSIPAGSVQTGDYFLQMRTAANLSTPPSSLLSYDSTVATGGFNRYSLRAGFGTTISGTGVAMFADGRLPIYVNQSAGATNFYLARITPEYAGQILQLEFYDVADGANSDLTVLPPPDQTGSALANCNFIRDDAPPAVITTTGCTITGLNSATYNGKTVTVQIPIPANYGCNSSSALGCWFKVALDFNGGTPRDTTTWSARVLGDPVRLVE